jgi:putative hydroxymethylpyrimidine transporter CytX
MSNEKTSALSNALLWFGAAVSIAEIATGALIAPLGFGKGLAAVIAGHLIGCALLYFAGLIGAESGMAAIASSGISFGKYGSYVFSVFNILQLVGWTAVMILIGAKAFDQAAARLTGFSGETLWIALIGALIIVWIAAGIKNLGKINIFAVGGLFALTIVLSAVVFAPASASASDGSMTFGMAVELSAAMPISWLPLISDYTRRAKKPKAAAFASAGAYFVGSCWMYLIGLGAAVYAQTSDAAHIMLKAGLGVAALAIVLLSTVTTTFLDAYSAGVSFAHLRNKVGEKTASIAVCVVGMIIAAFTPITRYEGFLYLIGSVFVPMAAILISDYFILKKREVTEGFNRVNAVLWAAGFIIYRLFASLDTPVGSTVPVMIVIIALSILINGGMKLCLKKS